MESPRAEALNILAVSFGGPGDVNPFLSLGRALRRRGHRVVLVSNPYFESTAGEFDLEFSGFGSTAHLTQSMHAAHGGRCGHGAAHRPGQWLTQGISRWRRRTSGILRTMRWTFEEISREHSARKTVVVARGNVFGARIAQERLGAHLVTVHLQPAMFQSEYDAPGLPLPEGNARCLRWLRRGLWRAIDIYADRQLAAQTNAFRSELGLPRTQRLFSKWIHSPELVLGLFPDWFAQPQPDWPPSTHLTGFLPFDETGIREIPPRMEEFLSAGSPPVLFTAGSFHRNAGGFFQASTAACRSLGVRGVMLTPAQECVPSPLPEEIIHLPYVPLGPVLPRFAAVVHHGGIGTTALAFAAGVPQLVVPFTDDQSDNGLRVRRTGAGATVSLREYQGTAVRHLQSVITSEGIARTCRSLASKIDGEAALAHAVRLIEKAAV